jgi:hypothetical protein
MRVFGLAFKPVPMLSALTLGFLAGAVSVAITPAWKDQYQRRNYRAFLEEVVRPRLVAGSHSSTMVYIDFSEPEVKELRKPAICTHVPGATRGGVISE